MTLVMKVPLLVNKKRHLQMGVNIVHFTIGLMHFYEVSGTVLRLQRKPGQSPLSTYARLTQIKSGDMYPSSSAT